MHMKRKRKGKNGKAGSGGNSNGNANQRGNCKDTEVRKTEEAHDTKMGRYRKSNDGKKYRERKWKQTRHRKRERDAIIENWTELHHRKREARRQTRGHLKSVSLLITIILRMLKSGRQRQR